MVLVLDQGPIPTSRLTTKALRERLWLSRDRTAMPSDLPKHAPEPDAIEPA